MNKKIKRKKKEKTRKKIKELKMLKFKIVNIFFLKNNTPIEPGNKQN